MYVYLHSIQYITSKLSAIIPVNTLFFTICLPQFSASPNLKYLIRKKLMQNKYVHIEFAITKYKY